MLYHKTLRADLTPPLLGPLKLRANVGADLVEAFKERGIAFEELRRLSKLLASFSKAQKLRP